jgi:hypothetical protein
MIDALCSIALLLLALPFKQAYVEFIMLFFRTPNQRMQDFEQQEQQDDANLAFLGFLSE